MNGCLDPVKTRGWCSKHYQRWRAHGDPLSVMKRHAPNGTLHRFFEEALLLETDDCILWPYAKGRSGYGVIGIEGKQYKVHRLALLRSTGVEDDPRVLCIHGHCHNKLCFNPRHLSWGDTRRNAEDRVRDGTHFTCETHPMSKLSWADVDEIRRRYRQGGVLQRELAAEFGCNQQQVSNIVNNRMWKST